MIQRQAESRSRREIIGRERRERRESERVEIVQSVEREQRGREGRLRSREREG
jgi:hypothetical protein